MYNLSRLPRPVMIRYRRIFCCTALLATCLTGCKADKFDKPDPNSDAAPLAAIEPPEIQSIPQRTPLSTVAARGVTDGARVVTQGSTGGTLVAVALPGGSFCQDTPIATEGDTLLSFYAMTGDGRISEAVEATVTFDSTAPQPPQPTCSGTLEECDEAETCGSDDEDEDCNGWADDCDQACNGCTDDIYEPNDFPVNVPSLSEGSYMLDLCPCRDDWFSFPVDTGQRIFARAEFIHADIDIDMALYIAGPQGQGTDGQVAGSASSNNEEIIDYTAEAPGFYYLRIFPFRSEDRPTGSYRLIVD